ncbi:MAG: DUF1217 domain-containing protein [Pseudomonadota bacterium]
MTFNPVIPTGGLAGWNFLSRTVDTQKEVFSNSSVVQRDLDYFKEEFPKVNSADELVNDRRLLGVALGSFGLQDDIDNRYFIKRVIEDGTSDPSALSNLLSDKRYEELASAFSFPNSSRFDPSFTSSVADAYVDQAFELAVGEQNEDFRLALNLQRSLGDLASSSISNDAKWFSVMGSPPMRKVFEVAFRLPTSFANLPIDDQLGVFKDRAQSAFGTDDLSQFSDPAEQDRIVDRFLLQSQLTNFSTFSSQSTALTLLQSSTISYEQ